MNKASLSGVTTEFLMIILGIVLLLMPTTAVAMLLRIIGGVLLAYCILQFLGKENYAQRGMGAVAAVVGLVLLIIPNTVANLFPIVAGVLILIDGIPKLIIAIKQPAGGAKTSMLVMAGITVLCGAILFFIPSGSIKLLVRVLGVILIYNGATGIWMNANK